MLRQIKTMMQMRLLHAEMSCTVYATLHATYRHIYHARRDDKTTLGGIELCESRVDAEQH